MAKTNKANQKKADNKTGNPTAKAAVSPKHALPVWSWILIVIVVVVGVFLLVQNRDQKQPVANQLPPEINVAEAAQLDPKDWFFLDVREPSEWAEVHIPYATLIPLGELTVRLSEIPKDQNIVVVCRSGNRSAVGRDLLLNSGFTNVTSMAGGMNTWQVQGHPVVTGP